MTIPSPKDKRFGLTPLPDWVGEFRSTQWEVIEAINESYQESDVVFLQAPTGLGKSLSAEVVRRINHWNAIYCCTTKALQDQFVQDFDYGKVVKGRANYLTEAGILDDYGNPSKSRWSAITCADCTWNSEEGKCRWCTARPLCPYQVARSKAEFAELAILNTSYFLTDCNKGKQTFAGRDLAIIDEADLLEHELLNHSEVVLSDIRLMQLDITRPKRKTAGVDNKGGRIWAEWIRKEALPKLGRYLRELTLPWDDGAVAEDIREWNWANQTWEKLAALRFELPKSRYVFDGAEDGSVIFRPVVVNNLGEQLLWPYAKKFLLMSATILSADLMAEELGLDKSFSLVDVDSDFPLENRRIHVCPIVDMSYRAKVASDGQTWRDMAKGIESILAQHPDDRVLVHTVSYDLARFIKDHLKLDGGASTANSRRPVIIYTDSYGKAAALDQYKRRRGSVLLAASMDRGIDLPGDLCRVQIVAKTPFPNLKDKRVDARLGMLGGANWYKMQAVRTLVQMCGRGIRSKDDWCVTYLPDKQFSDNLWKDQHLFPKYFREALNWKFNTRRLLKG